MADIKNFASKGIAADVPMKSGGSNTTAATRSTCTQSQW